MASVISRLTVVLVIVSCLTFTALPSQAEDDRVQVGVYFESKCPDSQAFFLDQLLPTYRSIGSIMKPMLVPFGKARVISRNRMICQHGSRECEGNKLMGCIMARGNDNQLEVLETIGCLFENSKSAQECVEANMPKASFSDIEQCQRGEESYKMMLEFEKMTGRLSYVPKITIGGQWSEEIQQDAEHNLKAHICKQYKATQPDGCKS